MINSGRKRQTVQNHRTTTAAARLTAILGAVVFAVFLCSSLARSDTSTNVSTDFGEGAYQVFAPTDAPIDEEAGAMEDDSLWAYLESVIARLIYGER